MNGRPITIRELAKRLQVSDATVSLALRNHRSISPATRERVQAMAKKLNYRGNVLVSALLAQVRRGRVSGNNEVVAILICDNEVRMAPSVEEGVRAASARAEELGLKLQIFPIGSSGEHASSVDRVLHARGIRGVVMAPVPVSLPKLHINWDRYAWITIGYSFQQQNMHRVAHAHFTGVMTCYRELRARGYENIGFVLRQEDDLRAQHFWQAAARCAPHILGGKVVPPLMFKNIEESGRFTRWYARHRLDAVIGNYPDPAAEWIDQASGDAVYASLDLHYESSKPGIRQSWNGIFCTAIDQLAVQLTQNEHGLTASPRTTLVEGYWEPGSLVEKVVTAG